LRRYNKNAQVCFAKNFIGGFCFFKELFVKIGIFVETFLLFINAFINNWQKLEKIK